MIWSNTASTAWQVASFQKIKQKKWKNLEMSVSVGKSKTNKTGVSRKSSLNKLEVSGWHGNIMWWAGGGNVKGTFRIFVQQHHR